MGDEAAQGVPVAGVQRSPQALAGIGDVALNLWFPSTAGAHSGLKCILTLVWLQEMAKFPYLLNSEEKVW